MTREEAIKVLEGLTVKRQDGRLALANNDGSTPMEQMEKIPAAIDRLAACEGTRLGPEEITTEPYGCVFYCNRKCNLDGDFCAEGPGCPRELMAEDAKHLFELAQVEKDGRLIVPPCKAGDMVYEANKRGFISIYKVISIHISDCSMLIGWELVDGIYSNLNGFEVSALGKTVFLTREEAEAALKKREAEDSEAVR